jgi:small conductance mechanosensitive channel
VPTEISYFSQILNDLFQPTRIEALVEDAIAIVFVLVGARVALALLIPLLRRWLRPDDQTRSPDRQAQMRTLVPLFESVLRQVIYFTAAVMILDRLHFSVAALLASAGIAGIAVGLGAQNFIRDVVSGFFTLFEGLIQVGDAVRIGDVTGDVERVNLRTTQVRRFSGELVTIPNGTIQQLGNLNRGFMRAIVQVGVAYEADLEHAMTVMHQVGETWAAERPDEILEPPQVQGITEFGASDVRVRLIIMVKPTAYGTAEPELRRRLKAAFDLEGIEIPYPKSVVYNRGAPTASPDAKG